MKVVLAALNARYSHSSLALRYLQRYCEGQFPNLETVEFNINQKPPDHLGGDRQEKARCGGLLLLHLEH